MTRLEAALKAYEDHQNNEWGSKHIGIVASHSGAMQAAMNAADAYNLTEYAKIQITERSRPLAQSFITHFREHWRNCHNGCFSSDLADMSNAIGVALEKAFEERERK